MPCNYSDMYNSLSILHKKNSSTITNLLEKNKKLCEEISLKDIELEKSKEKMKEHIKQIEDLTDEVKKLKKTK